MSISKDEVRLFLGILDELGERLEPPRRPEDQGIADCTQRQLSALRMVNQHGPLKMGELARSIQVPLSTATRVVKQLEAKSLLQRRQSKHDARVVEIDFAPQGKKIQRYIDRVRSRKAHHLLTLLDHKDREHFLDMFTNLLEELD